MSKQVTILVILPLFLFPPTLFVTVKSFKMKATWNGKIKAKGQKMGTSACSFRVVVSIRKVYTDDHKMGSSAKNSTTTTTITTTATPAIAMYNMPENGKRQDKMMIRIGAELCPSKISAGIY